MHPGERYRQLIDGSARGIVPALLRGALCIGSVPYGAATRMRNWLFDRGWKKTVKAGCPVVSVGNLTVGGTGKTPMVEYIARYYRQSDRRVVLLSRGYGAVNGPNDEALVLEENLPDVPHLQGIDRVALAQTALVELESEVIVLDDGFQYRRLARDLNLLLIDATQPWGFGWQLPRGLLRESKRGLGRADAIVLTRCNQIASASLQVLLSDLRKRSKNRFVFASQHEPEGLMDSEHRQEKLSALQNRPVLAFCGIGNPVSFFNQLKALEADICRQVTFPDHHPYTRADVQMLTRYAQELPATGWVITTQKDLVKLRVDRLADRRLLALKIGLQLQDQAESFHSLLDRVFQQ